MCESGAGRESKIAMHGLASLKPMSYDEEDARQDAYMDSLVDDFFRTYGPEIEGEAVARFQEERLQSYFVAHPRVIESAVRQLEKARALLAAGHVEAAIVFAASATEVALKQALFMPVVHGLVQSEPAAKIIAELTLGHRAIGRYSGLVLDVFSNLLGADFRKYVHAGGSKILWEEIQASAGHRNKIVHEGEQRTTAEAEVALRSASAVIDTVFPAIAKSAGLHVHGVELCNRRECGP